LRKRLRAILDAVLFVFSVTAIIMIVLVDRLVNGTLYSYGLQFSSGWAFPYQIYFDVALALVIINALIVSLGFRYSEGSQKKEASDSTFEFSSQPQTQENAQLKKKLSAVYCRYCGHENEPDAVFCEKCGKRIAHVSIEA